MCRSLPGRMGNLSILQHKIRRGQHMHLVQPDHVKGTGRIEPDADDRGGCGGAVTQLPKGGNRAGAPPLISSRPAPAIDPVRPRATPKSAITCAKQDQIVKAAADGNQCQTTRYYSPNRLRPTARCASITTCGRSRTPRS